jgi:hypothetical protein
MTRRTAHLSGIPLRNLGEPLGICVAVIVLILALRQRTVPTFSGLGVWSGYMIITLGKQG